MAQVTGEVDETGEVLIGKNYVQAGLDSTGKYNVTFLGSYFSNTPVVVATTVGGGDSADAINVSDASSDGFSITIKTPSGDYADKGFNFIATDSEPS